MPLARALLPGTASAGRPITAECEAFPVVTAHPRPAAALHGSRSSSALGLPAQNRPMAAPLLFNPPAAGFDQPFEMLAACHERVARMLALLERLAEYLGSRGCDEQACGAARDVMRYFDLAAPAHHEDEERHVFPALRRTGADALVAQLQAQHHAMAEHWAALRPALAAVAEGRWRADEPAMDPALWSAFAALYREHLAIEDSQAFPAACRHLDDPAQRAMGAEMARRRGVV